MHAIRHWKYQILNFWPKNFTGSKSGNLILYWRKCENPSFFVYFWENWGNLSIENFVSTFTSQIFRHDTAWGLPFQTHYRMWNYHMEFMNKKCFELWNIIEKKGKKSEICIFLKFQIWIIWTMRFFKNLMYNPISNGSFNYLRNSLNQFSNSLNSLSETLNWK